jgi:hypothetical protein
MFLLAYALGRDPIEGLFFTKIQFGPPADLAAGGA